MIREEVEVCPHCEQEITIDWDVEKDGYQVVCPNCGKKIMLCSACLAYGDESVTRCDWTEKGGCWRKPKEAL